MPGIVVALNYREDHWPPSKANAPYQVMLEEAAHDWRLICVHDDAFCKKPELQQQQQCVGNENNPRSVEPTVVGFCEDHDQQCQCIAFTGCLLVIGIFGGVVIPRLINSMCC